MANNEESQKSSKIKNNIFENEEMSRHLRKLLHSKDPYDLQTANRLIKVMVKEVNLSKLRKIFVIIFQNSNISKLKFLLPISL